MPWYDVKRQLDDAPKQRRASSVREKPRIPLHLIKTNSDGQNILIVAGDEAKHDTPSNFRHKPEFDCKNRGSGKTLESALVVSTAVDATSAVMATSSSSPEPPDPARGGSSDSLEDASFASASSTLSGDICVTTGERMSSPSDALWADAGEDQMAAEAPAPAQSPAASAAGTHQLRVVDDESLSRLLSIINKASSCPGAEAGGTHLHHHATQSFSAASRPKINTRYVGIYRQRSLPFRSASFSHVDREPATPGGTMSQSMSTSSSPSPASAGQKLLRLFHLKPGSYAHSKDAAAGVKHQHQHQQQEHQAATASNKIPAPIGEEPVQMAGNFQPQVRTSTLSLDSAVGPFDDTDDCEEHQVTTASSSASASGRTSFELQEMQETGAMAARFPLVQLVASSRSASLDLPMVSSPGMMGAGSVAAAAAAGDGGAGDAAGVSPVASPAP
ncbi:unnamed protein product, partial [Notodromas monacha]